MNVEEIHVGSEYLVEIQKIKVRCRVKRKFLGFPPRYKIDPPPAKRTIFDVVILEGEKQGRVERIYRPIKFKSLLKETNPPKKRRGV